MSKHTGLREAVNVAYTEMHRARRRMEYASLPTFETRRAEYEQAKADWRAALTAWRNREA